MKRGTNSANFLKIALGYAPAVFIFQIFVKKFSPEGSVRTNRGRKSNGNWLTQDNHAYAVAQYAVLEANGKVSGIGKNSPPSPPQTLDQFGCRFKYITTSAQGVDVPNLIKIDSAVAALRMREKNTMSRGVFLIIHIYLSIRSSPRLHAAFLARF